MNSALEQHELTADGPKGIGGWLLLPIIYLFLTVIFSVGYFIISFLLINSGEWTEVVNSPEVHPHFEKAIYFEIACNALLLFISIYLIIIFFKKKKFFPKAIISYSVLNMILDIVDALLINNVNPVNEPASTSVSSFVLSIIWIIYFRVSKRVRNTFVHE